MMARRNRLAFTLVELLVVIVIISMLIAMLVPAVSRSRESGRRAQCMSNQHEISLAMAQYESSVNRFPGYINKMGTGAIIDSTTSRQMPLSWVTVLLPHLGRQDMWREWRALNVSATLVAPRVVRLPQVVCPSDVAKRDYVGALSYVANCGVQDNNANNPPDSAANGVFHNLYGYYVSGNTPPWTQYTTPSMTASGIRDGASHTLMLSENIQAGVWHAKPFVDPSSTSNIEQVFEPNLGFVWVAAPAAVRINSNKDDTSASDHSSFPWPTSYNYARPSSYHPQGVVVSYCDGRQQFLSENIDYGTLRHLMTPNSVAAGLGTFTADPELTE